MKKLLQLMSGVVVLLVFIYGFQLLSQFEEDRLYNFCSG